MRCDELNRWLDEGAPESGAAVARAHAAVCADCAGAIEAFDSLELALASPAPTLPNAASFTALVMEQLERPGFSAAPAVSPAPTPAPTPWWVALLSEPAFVVALVAAIILLTTPAALRVEAGRSLILPLVIASESLGAQFAQAIQIWLGPLAFTQPLSPLARLYVFIGFAPLFLWAGFWMFGAVERLFRGAPPRRG